MNGPKPMPGDLPLDAAFALVKRARSLGPGATGNLVILQSELLRYAYGEAVTDRARIEQALAEDAGLASRFDALLASRRRLFAPKLVAAQSDPVPDQRQGDQFVIKLRTSKASPSQVYIILELDDLAPVDEGESVRVFVSTPGSSTSVAFPPVHDRRTQVINERDSLLFRLLCHPDAQISVL